MFLCVFTAVDEEDYSNKINKIIDNDFIIIDEEKEEL